MSFSFRPWTLALGVALIGLQGPARGFCGDSIEFDRRGLAYGAHLGIGTGQIEDGNEDHPRRLGMSSGMWIGHGVNQSLVWRLDVKFWTKMRGVSGMSLAEPIVGAAFYPSGKSLFLHGGIGAGYVSLEPWDVGTTPVFGWGPDLFLGVGYEFPLSNTLAISVHMDANYTHLGAVGPREIKLQKVGVNYSDVVISLNWY